MKIAFIGIGSVGSALADGLARAGHEVVVAARDVESASVRAALAKNPTLTATDVPTAVAAADIVFLATPFKVNEAVIESAGSLAGKTIVDCTNPVGTGISHGLDNEISGGEFVQNLVPDAKVVKAFNIYGFENFADTAYPGYGELKPAMLIAGNDAGAKATVAGLCEQLGWTPVDTGDIAMSLHLEHLALLWIKMARIQGKGSGFVWAMLTR
jgi:predicted dinucleotide-binding enzyme